MSESDEVKSLREQIQAAIAREREAQETLARERGEAQETLARERKERGEERAAFEAALATSRSAHRDGAGGQANRVTPEMPRLQLLSPTSGNAALALQGDTFVEFVGTPISLPDTSAEFRFVLKACDGDPAKLMQEKLFYDLALAHVPAFAEKRDGRQSAGKLYGAAGMSTSRFGFDSKAKPELAVRGAGRGTLGPAFGGEIKSVDSFVLGQALYYLLMDIARIFFPVPHGTRTAPRVFYSKPPVGYSLIAFPHVGWYMGVELVGKVVMSFVSEPFALGGLRHEGAAAALPDIEYDDRPVRELNMSLPWKSWESEGLPQPVFLRGAAASLRLVPSGIDSTEALSSLATSASNGGDGVSPRMPPPVAQMSRGSASAAAAAAQRPRSSPVAAPRGLAAVTPLTAAHRVAASKTVPAQPVFPRDPAASLHLAPSGIDAIETLSSRFAASASITSQVAQMSRGSASAAAAAAAVTPARPAAAEPELRGPEQRKRRPGLRPQVPAFHTKSAAQSPVVPHVTANSAAQSPAVARRAAATRAAADANRAAAAADRAAASERVPAPASIARASATGVGTAVHSVGAPTSPRPKLAPGAVCWARDGDSFLKLVRGDARTAEEFRGMYRAYTLLGGPGGILAREDRPAELLPRARLLYGQHEVLVEMAAVDGTECTDAEVTETDGPVMHAAARGVAWLARHRLVYTDLRGPNVLKSPLAAAAADGAGIAAGGAAAGAGAAAAGVPAAWLIDYDDCVVTDRPVETLEGYVAALQSFANARRTLLPAGQPVSLTFADVFVDGDFMLLRGALRDAFAGFATAAAAAGRAATVPVVSVEDTTLAAAAAAAADTY